jgi:hypothetical protein
VNELELLLLRLEDLSESAENKDAKVLAKALKRYFENTNKEKMGFTHEAKRTGK